MCLILIECTGTVGCVPSCDKFIELLMNFFINICLVFSWFSGGVKVQIRNCVSCGWFVIYLNIIGRKFVRDVTVRDVTPNSSHVLIKPP